MSAAERCFVKLTNQYYKPIIYTVTATEDGNLLKTVLQRKLGISRKLMSRLKVTEQGIMLNGTRVYISEKVKPGDLVEVRLEQESSDDILPQPIPFDILYEDEALLIVNKQPGIVVHPTKGHYANTLANGVVYYWQQKGEQVRFRPVHRLDQETSGVLAIAKNAYVHQHISEQMIAGNVTKKYTAMVHSTPELTEGSVNEPIDRDPEEPHRRIVTPSGYPSLTYYKVRERYAHGSWVELQLGTGRTHQIRVHMSYLGCPLIGDKLYDVDHLAQALSSEKLEIARKLDESMSRQALHAEQLGFVHPLTGEMIVFTAPLPADMEELKQHLTMNKM